MWKTAELNSLTQPPMRSKTACAVLGHKLYLHGGLGAGAVGTLWSLDLKVMRWEQARSRRERADETRARARARARPRLEKKHSARADARN